MLCIHRTLLARAHAAQMGTCATEPITYNPSPLYLTIPHVCICMITIATIHVQTHRPSLWQHPILCSLDLHPLCFAASQQQNHLLDKIVALPVTDIWHVARGHLHPQPLYLETIEST